MPPLQVPGLDPWDFLGDRSIFVIHSKLSDSYSNKMTQIGAGHTRRPTIRLEGWSFESYDISPTSEVERGVRDWVQLCIEIESINHACNETPREALVSDTQVNFLVGNTLVCSRRVTSLRTQKLYLGFSYSLLYICLLLAVLIYILLL